MPLSITLRCMSVIFMLVAFLSRSLPKRRLVGNSDSEMGHIPSPKGISNPVPATDLLMDDSPVAVGRRWAAQILACNKERQPGIHPDVNNRTKAAGACTIKAQEQECLWSKQISRAGGGRHGLSGREIWAVEEPSAGQKISVLYTCSPMAPSIPFLAGGLFPTSSLSITSPPESKAMGGRGRKGGKRYCTRRKETWN